MCEAELLDESVPYYTFFVKAEDREEAEMIATDIARDDYHEIADIMVYEINTLEDLEEYCL